MQILEIWLYPVKGLRGISVSEIAVEPWGVAGDRRWAIIDVDGRCMSQREVPQLATFSVVAFGGDLMLSAPDGTSHVLHVPGAAAEQSHATIWGELVPIKVASCSDNMWISNLLRGQYRFAYMYDPSRSRTVDTIFGRENDCVSFADGFPLLLVTKPSFDDLSERMAVPIDISRFRANVIVDGEIPWAEDNWREISLGEISFRVAKPCARCVVTTVDQTSGHKAVGGEPLRTLSTFRRNGRGEVIFGQNLIPDTLGSLRIGDVVSPK
jgi:uncharacterized protein YcbX